jgi:Nicotine adenine dinucleotide glycohydrolase (NADase)
VPWPWPPPLAITSLGGSAAKSTPTSVATTVVATTVQTSTASTAPTTAVAVRGTPIDPSMIVSAEATSTLPDQDGLTYGIANTLDGQITTGWNSNGSTPGSGVDPVGQKLTYKLSAPQHIVGVRLINGYNPNDAKHQFTDNHRVQSLVVRGGGKERKVELADTFAPQFVEVDLPNVDTIELEVAAVYPTTKWADVGITEVQFFAG